jgi:mycothiol synthase
MASAPRASTPTGDSDLSREAARDVIPIHKASTGARYALGMDLPLAYQVRAPAPDDLDAVAIVLVAGELHDAGHSVLDADFLQDQWSRVGFDLGTDAWVVVHGEDAIVAYGQARREEAAVVESWAVVHPGHRGRGIGAWLLARIQQRASELLTGVPSARFRHAINAGDRAAAAMLAASGLRPVRHFWHMQIHLAAGFQPGPPPDGIRISGIDPQVDLPAVHAVLEEAFADHWGHHREPFDRWAREQTGSPSYDPTLWLLAREAGEPVGALTASAARDGGWVDELGVLAPWRGRGIGAALLLRSFAAFAGRGLRRVLLSVDAENPTGATRLYERVGMRVVNRWDWWERSSGGPP